MSATARSILSDSLQGGARQGPPGQIHTGREPSENIDAGAVDIPGAIPYTFTLPRGGETALYASSTNLASSLPISDTDVPHVVGSMTLGYGTSPGHGLGHMMRSRRRPAPTLGRRNSSKEFALPSHSEYAEFLATSQSSPDYPDAEAGMAAGLDDSYIFSPLASGQVDENKVFSLSHNELTAPLLPARSASGAVTSVAKTPASKAAVFGTINAIAGIPALVAYAAIVFRHPVYAPYVDLLCKMFFISSALHQSVFCLLSTIPFAMGQVQDVGIIFLSAMGTSVAEIVLGEGKDAPTALGTALLTMTTSTFIVGLGTLFVGQLC